MKTKIKKLDVAVTHLETAIDMFLHNKDHLCVLTLTGAADVILGQYANRAGDETMLDLLTSSLKKEYSLNMSDKDFKWEYLNSARNTVKHFNKTESEVIEIDPEEEALTMIIRAIGNLYSHDKSITHNTPALLKWVCDNRESMLPLSQSQS